jgi:hypothetical protein
MKKTSAAIALAIAIATPLVANATTNAEAGSLTNTSTNTNTLTSNPKCYHHHGVSVTTFHWDSKQGRYVAYDSPHKSTTDYIKCHK